MDAATAQAWMTAGAGLAGALVGGAAAVLSQLLAARQERKLAHDAWVRQRRQWSFEQEADTYLALLAQLRDIDRYHGKLNSTSDIREASQVPRPQLKDSDVDRVNAFASEAISSQVNRAMKADGEIRTLLTSADDSESAGEEPASIIDGPYREFRAAHSKIRELVRSSLRSEAP